MTAINKCTVSDCHAKSSEIIHINTCIKYHTASMLEIIAWLLDIWTEILDFGLNSDLH